MDGWNIDPTPTLMPDPDEYPEELWGIEDPRITYVPELQQYAVAYTSYSKGGPGVSLALTSDFRSFERFGVIMSPDDKDAALLPHRIDGLWALIHRPMTGVMRSASAAISARASWLPRTRARPRSGPAPGRGWPRTTWCGSRPAGRTGCARGSTRSMVPSSCEPCHSTRSPTTASLFLPRGWQIRRSPRGSRPGNGGRGWRPPARVEAASACRRALTPRALSMRHHASSASTCAAHSKSVADRPFDVVRVEAHHAAVVVHRQVGMMVLRVGDEGDAHSRTRSSRNSWRTSRSSRSRRRRRRR